MKKIITSIDSPLRIDTYQLENGGAIGMTICPGKKRRNSRSGDWNRDLDIDIQAIKDWGADVVITLLEDFEFAEVGVEELKDRVVEYDMNWIHLPIPDGQAPSKEFIKRWLVYGPHIHRCLRDQKKILIHCMGGVGRTGAVAAQILIEQGMGVMEAIATIRKVRKGAIETPEQEEYLKQLNNQK